MLNCSETTNGHQWTRMNGTFGVPLSGGPRF
jgi:hypothetical protein